MLSYQTVNSHTLELLKKLTNEEFLSKARLVGGTALALQYGHRISIDLDFFGNIEEDNETIKEVLINIGKLSVIKESKNIKIYILDDIKIDFVNYRYNWLDPAIEENGIRLASPRYCSNENKCNRGTGNQKRLYRYLFPTATLFTGKHSKILC